MSAIHHSAICVSDVDASLRFWREGLGFEVLMDRLFEGDWPTLLLAPTRSLRALFLGDPANRESGIVELLDLGEVDDRPGSGADAASTGFFLLSVMTDLNAVLGRLSALGLGGEHRRIEVSGVAMAVVTDPDGVLVELVDAGATSNLERLAAPENRAK